MIQLTLLSGKVFFLNPDQLEYMESNPDTTLVLLSGKHIIVTEDPALVIERIVAFRNRIITYQKAD
jgi:flagellar protein FlbD